MLEKKSFFVFILLLVSSLVFGQSMTRDIPNNNSDNSWLNSEREIRSKDGKGSFFVKIKDFNINEVEKNTLNSQKNTKNSRSNTFSNSEVEVVINYEIRHNFPNPVSKYQLSFNLVGESNKTLMLIDENINSSLKPEEVKSGTLRKKVSLKVKLNESQRKQLSAMVKEIKLEIKNAYLERSRQAIKF